MQLKQAVDDFVIGYFSTNQRSSKTRTAYELDLRQFLKFASEQLSLKLITPTLIEEWAAHLRQQQYSPASMRRKVVVLKVFCGYWMRKGELTESPFWRVKLSFGRIEQLPRALTESEIRDLLAQAAQIKVSDIPRKGAALAKRKELTVSSLEYRELRNLALVDLLFATGIRVGEASALNIDDFDINELVFRVKGKGGRHRLAYVVDTQTVSIQLQYRQARSRIAADNPALFLNSSRQRLSTQGIANIIAQFRKDAGIERNITPHMLRHTVATLLLRNGVDIRVVQEFLGHASIATTQRYTHVAKEHLIGVLRKSHPSLGLRMKA